MVSEEKMCQSTEEPQGTKKRKGLDIAAWAAICLIVSGVIRFYDFFRFLGFLIDYKDFLDTFTSIIFITIGIVINGVALMCLAVFLFFAKKMTRKLLLFLFLLNLIGFILYLPCGSSDTMLGLFGCVIQVCFIVLILCGNKLERAHKGFYFIMSFSSLLFVAMELWRIIENSLMFSDLEYGSYCNQLIYFISYVCEMFAYIFMAILLTKMPLSKSGKKLTLSALIGIGAGTVLGFLIASISAMSGNGYVYFSLAYVKVFCVLAMIAICVGLLVFPFSLVAKQPEEKRSCSGSEHNMPNGYLSIGMFILFSLLTLGIYSWVWVYRVTKYLNNSPRAEQQNPTTKLLLYIFVPFYYIYWFYNQGQRLDSMAKGSNADQSDMAVTYLVLGLFIPIVATILMQDRINKVCLKLQSSGKDYQTLVYQENIEVSSKPRNEENTTVTEPEAKDPACRANDSLKYLENLHTLLESGVITQEDFDAKKKEILGL